MNGLLLSVSAHFDGVIGEIEGGVELVALEGNPPEGPIPVTGVRRRIGKTLERLITDVFRIEEPRLQIKHIGQIDEGGNRDIGISICIRQGERVAETLLSLEKAETHLLCRAQTERHVSLNEWILCPG